ncbi:MAG: hypothetical protein QXF12_07770, partial [Candidatus Aenigmatarchaeota archaeon]
TQILPEFFANGSYVYSCPSSQANLSCASPYNFSASKENTLNSTIEYINQSKTIIVTLNIPKYITIVGKPELWEWNYPNSSILVRVGSPQNWTWQTWQSDSKRLIPSGSPQNWTWIQE